MALPAIYGGSLALLTDLYQLTMAYGHWKLGTLDREAAFHLSFRKNPFHGGYAIACGLAAVVEYLANLRFDDSDLNYLATLRGNDGAALFDEAFLRHLREFRLTVDVDAVPEGTVAFAHEPLVRVVGPIDQCQILETALLNLVNFPTLVATKAARVRQAAKGEPVLEFGLRRAQGIDGSLTASRAAYVGGCEATSNVLAGKLFDIPVRGTHAHSWIMSFDTELEAFDAYASAMPNNCTFLVDTYDTIEGVRHAIGVGQRLRSAGHRMAGIRLDSGDLAYLSIEARKLLDAAGFTEAKILASNDLDEQIITSLKEQDAKINVWCVGTKLATAYDQPALGGVYKLSAIRNADGSWRPKIKLSEQTAKVSIPGVLGVRRFSVDGRFSGDAIYNVHAPAPSDAWTIVDPSDLTRTKTFPSDAAMENLLVPIMRKGQIIYQAPSATAARQRAGEQLDRLHPSIKRFTHPHSYPVGLEASVHELRTNMVLQAREQVRRIADS